jgi:hypothetical protein
MRNKLNLPSKGEKGPNFLKKPIFRNESGASAVFVAVSLFMLLAMTGLVIDLGHLYVVRQELQNAADAGADAGAMALYWLGNDTNARDSKDLLNCAYAQLKATEVVSQNKSDGKNLSISPADIDVGVWQYNPASNAWEFQELPCDPANAYTINAVRVTTRRSNDWNGPVNLWFGSFLGLDRVELTGQATAMLGWVRNLRPGRGFPIAVGEDYVLPLGQKMPVTFKNDWSDTGCWHTFKHPYPDADYIEDLVTGDWRNNDGVDPQDLDLKVGDNIMLKNGVATSVLKETANQFYNVHNGDWTVCLPVVNTTQFNQNKEVRGFVAFEITEVDTKEKTVSGWIKGGYVAPGTDTGTSSPGPNLGLRANIPKLVQ